MSYVYYSWDGFKNDNSAIFEVGHHKPDGRFILESRWDTHAEAQAQVSYLNGGKHPKTNLEHGL